MALKAESYILLQYTRTHIPKKMFPHLHAPCKRAGGSRAGVSKSLTQAGQRGQAARGGLQRGPQLSVGHAQARGGMHARVARRLHLRTQRLHLGSRGTAGFFTVFTFFTVLRQF